MSAGDAIEERGAVAGRACAASPSVERAARGGDRLRTCSSVATSTSVTMVASHGLMTGLHVPSPGRDPRTVDVQAWHGRRMAAGGCRVNGTSRRADHVGPQRSVPRVGGRRRSPGGPCVPVVGAGRRPGRPAHAFAMSRRIPGIEVRRVRLVARAQVDDPAPAAPPRAAAAEHLAALEPATRAPARRAPGCRSARRTSPPRRGRTTRPAPRRSDATGRRPTAARARPSSRHLRSQVVPISRRKIREKWPEWRTTRPIPSRTRAWTRSTTSSVTSSWATWPHQVRTSVAARTAAGQAVLRLVERRGPHLEARPTSRSPSAIAAWMPSG